MKTLKLFSGIIFVPPILRDKLLRAQNQTVLSIPKWQVGVSDRLFYSYAVQMATHRLAHPNTQEGFRRICLTAEMPHLSEGRKALRPGYKELNKIWGESYVL